MLNKLLMFIGKGCGKKRDEGNRKNRRNLFLCSCLTALFLMITLWAAREQVAYGHSVFSPQYPHQYSTRSDNSPLIAQSAPSISPRSIDDLTGQWNCDDGGTYFLRQIGNVLWWYGASADAGASWSNIFWGNIQGDQIAGEWADVPKGNILGGGEMSLVLESAFTLKVISKTGGFGGNTWNRN